MTYAEALEYAESYLTVEGVPIDAHNAAACIAGALKKQIPKPPDLEGDGYDENGEMIYDTWICPGCGESYEIDYEEHDYCPNCGQAIDWREQE